RARLQQELEIAGRHGPLPPPVEVAACGLSMPRADSARESVSAGQPLASRCVHAGDKGPLSNASCRAIISTLASEASLRRAATRAPSVSGSAVSHMPRKGTPALPAANSIAERCAGV